MNQKKYIPIDLISLLVFALGLCYLAFIWSFNYFPTMDGPSHISNGKIISDLILGKCPLNHEVFEFTKTIVPNWISYFFSAILSNFLPPELINKIFLSAIIISYVGGLYKLVTTISKENIFLVLFGMIFTLSVFFYSGTYNYLFGINIFLFASAYWLGGLQKDKIKLHVIFLYFMLLYLSHIFALVAFCFVIFFTLAWRIFFLKEYSLIKFGIKVGLVFLPFAVFFAHYYSLPKAALASFVDTSNNLSKIIPILTISSFGNDSKVITYVITLIFWQLFAITFYRVYREKISSTKKYIFALFLLFLAGYLSPVSFAGGWMISQRIQSVFIVISLIMFSSVAYSKPVKTVLSIAFTIINLMVLFNNYPPTKEIDVRLQQMMAMQDKIPNNSSFLTVNLSPTYRDFNSNIESGGVLVADITGYLTFQGCITNLGNFHSSEKNTFPIKYTDKYNPYENMGKFRDLMATTLIPPDLDLEKYKTITGRTPDYVIVWGKENMTSKSDGYNNKELYRKFIKQLDMQHYTTYYSNPEQTIRIFKSN